MVGTFPEPSRGRRKQPIHSIPYSVAQPLERGSNNYYSIIQGNNTILMNTKSLLSYLPESSPNKPQEYNINSIKSRYLKEIIELLKFFYIIFEE
ncbi:MAG: hypothetical protein ACLSVP_05290 [Fusobacterium sp.]